MSEEPIYLLEATDQFIYDNHWCYVCKEEFFVNSTIYWIVLVLVRNRRIASYEYEDYFCCPRCGEEQPKKVKK